MEPADNSIPQCEDIEFYYRRSARLLEGNADIAEIRGSAGPEKSVTWRQYYRYSDNLFSEIFYYTLAAEDEMIVYATQGSVIIQDIFDKGRYCLEITEFQEPFAKMIDPIQSAVFVGDHSAIEITYFAGEDHHTVHECFDLEMFGS
ncbi:MAG: hypothetical protein J6P40_06185 [Oscillospiraceae bacterium]|nr:hypothetical protein [Oscillospiraceae bacterium]